MNAPVPPDGTPPDDYDYLEVKGRQRVPNDPHEDTQPEAEIDVAGAKEPPQDESDVSSELVRSGLAVPCVSCGENVILGPAEIASCPHCGFEFEQPLAAGKFEGLDIGVPPLGPVPEPPTLLGRGDDPKVVRFYAGPGARIFLWQALVLVALVWGGFKAREVWGFPPWNEATIFVVAVIVALFLTAGTSRRFGARWFRLTPFELTARWLWVGNMVRLNKVDRVESWVVIRMKRNPLRMLEDRLFSVGTRFKRFDVKTRFKGRGGSVMISTYSLGYDGWLQACREALHYVARHNPQVQVDLNTLTLLGYRQEATGGEPGWEDPGEAENIPQV
jgi:hypothetical protein